MARRDWEKALAAIFPGRPRQEPARRPNAAGDATDSQHCAVSGRGAQRCARSILVTLPRPRAGFA